MILLSLTLALAQDDASTPEAPPLDQDELGAQEEVVRDGIFEVPIMEVVITDERAVQMARQAVEQELVDLGYEAKRRRDDRTVYVSDVGWENKVIVHDDGWMYFRKRPPHVRKPEIEGAWWNGVPVVEWGPCLLAPFLCVSAGTVGVRPQLSEQNKEEVVEGTAQEMRDYADTIAAEALGRKLNEEIPDWLDAVWHQGVDPRNDTALPTPEARRAHILEFWISRTDNAYGDAVRQVVEHYMLYEIQSSTDPFTQNEIDQANARRRCQRELVLEELPW